MALKLADIYVEATLNTSKLDSSLTSVKQRMQSTTASMQSITATGSAAVSNSMNNTSKANDGMKQSLDNVQKGINPLSGGLHQIVGAMTALGLSSKQSAAFMQVLGGIAMIDMAKGFTEVTKGLWASVAALGAYATAANSAAIGSLALNTQIGIGGLLGSIKLATSDVLKFTYSLLGPSTAMIRLIKVFESFTIMFSTSMQIGKKQGLSFIESLIKTAQIMPGIFNNIFAPYIGKGIYSDWKNIFNKIVSIASSSFAQISGFARHMGSTLLSMFSTVGKAALSLLFNPLGFAITAIVAALAVLAYAFYSMYQSGKKMDEITESTKKYAESVKEAANALSDLKDQQNLTRIGSFGKTSAQKESGESKDVLSIAENRLKYEKDRVEEQKRAIKNGEVDAKIGATQLAQMQNYLFTAQEQFNSAKERNKQAEIALALAERAKAIEDLKTQAIKNQVNFTIDLLKSQGKSFDANIAGINEEQSVWKKGLDERINLAKESGDTVLKDRLAKEEEAGNAAFEARRISLNKERKESIAEYLATEEEKQMITLAAERDKLLLNAKTATETKTIWMQYYTKLYKAEAETKQKRNDMSKSLDLETITNKIDQEKQASLNQLDIWYRENLEYANKNGFKLKLDAAYAAQKEKIELDTAQKVYDAWSKKETEFTNKKIASLGMIKQGVMTNLISPEEQKKADARQWKQDLVNSLRETPGGAEIYERYRKQIDAVYNSMSKSKITAGQFTDVASNWKDTQSKILSGKNYQEENLGALKKLEIELQKSNNHLKMIEAKNPGVQN